jgi:hypothetical protein
MKKIILIVLALGLRTASAQFDEVFENYFFHATDPLAPQGDWGLLHQSRTVVYEPEFAHRYPFRWPYYFLSGKYLSGDPAYVGALQRDLKRLGYYCGPIDGVFTVEVSESIARLQKNYSQRINGRLTVPVRRVLHLP